MKRCLFVLWLFLTRDSFSCDVSKWNPFVRQDQHVAALILARGGSKGIPLKNLAKLGNESLLLNALRAIYKTDGFSSVWVSTDHLAIAEEAERGSVCRCFSAKANIHWRAKETATDFASSLSAVQEFLTKHLEVDYVALAQCTSPFINEKYLQEALEYLRSSCECVFSVTRSFKLRWIKTSGGNVEPLNFDPKHRPRRQDWKGELVENGMFYFSKRELAVKGLFQTKR